MTDYSPGYSDEDAMRDMVYLWERTTRRGLFGFRRSSWACDEAKTRLILYITRQQRAERHAT